MAVSIPGGTPVTAVITSGATIAELVARWRLKLDDTEGGDDDTAYLWGDEELVDYMNQALIQMSEFVPIFKDMTTTAIVQISVSEDDTELTLSDRVTHIYRAQLASDDLPLDIVELSYMDRYYSDWQDADSGDVQLLIKNVENGIVRLYPPSDQDDTLSMVVSRITSGDFTYQSNSGDTLDLRPQYYECLEYGVLMRAFQKADIDSENAARAEKFESKFKQAYERLKRSWLRLNTDEEMSQPLLGNI